MSLSDCMGKAGKALNGDDRQAIESLIASGVSETDAVTHHLAALDRQLNPVSETQDFGDVQLTEDMQVEGTDDSVRITDFAQRKFDQAVKRRNVLMKLRNCVGAS